VDSPLLSERPVVTERLRLRTNDQAGFKGILRSAQSVNRTGSRVNPEYIAVNVEAACTSTLFLVTFLATGVPIPVAPVLQQTNRRCGSRSVPNVILISRPRMLRMVPSPVTAVDTDITTVLDGIAPIQVA
jgi:hypothetical protein